MTPLVALKKYFGYSHFRSGQELIISSVVAGHDTLALLPTGGGKSVCFQVPGLVLGGVTLVISPLISLMEDQVKSLTAKGITATWLSSTLSEEELRNRVMAIQDQQFQFIYCAPERLHLTSFLKICLKLPITLVAIDEAHCVSLWGNEFRPEYGQIANFLLKLKQKPKLIALTATATPKVVSDILIKLSFSAPHVYKASFARPNLSLQVHTVSAETQLLKLLKIVHYWKNSSGIIYTLTRRSAEKISRLLNFYQPWLHQAYYHGGMNAAQRSDVQHQFITDKLQLVIATNAFGMGIDKPDIRYVVHYEPSLSIENYYQEVGRAGRDGNLSWCYLLFEPKKATELHNQFLSKSNPDSHAQARQQSEAILELLHSNTCLHTQLLHYFGEQQQHCSCLRCSSCCFTPLPQKTHQLVLRNELKTLTATLARRSGFPAKLIASPLQLEWLSLLKPTTKTAFLKVPGIGFGWLEQWFSPYSGIITRYAQSKNFKKISNDP